MVREHLNLAWFEFIEILNNFLPILAEFDLLKVDGKTFFLKKIDFIFARAWQE